MSKSKRVKIGDYFTIPLGNSKVAFGQYIIYDSKKGGIIRVLDLIQDDSVEFDIDSIKNLGNMFPPIFTGLKGAIKHGVWQIIGHGEINEVKYPGFISTTYNHVTGEANLWYLWNGKKMIRLGKRLNKHYKKYEFLVVWSHLSIAKRINSGQIPFPYADLINYNKFTLPDR